MAVGPYNNIVKAIPLDAYPDDIEVEEGPGVTYDPDLQGEEPEEGSKDNFEIVEDPDGGVTINFGDPEEEAPILGFGENLAEHIDESELVRISNELKTAIEDDDNSREEWKKVYEEGLSLLGLGDEERDEPFKGASGVIHPLLNEAVVQFQAQAYKELLPAGGPVRTAIIGTATPEKEDQAERVKNYLNYQITEVMEEYDPDFDQMLYHLGFGGSTFKKVYYDGELERAVSPYILPKDLIVPYSARDLHTAERVTHVVTLSENSLRKAQASGFYRDVDLKPSEPKRDVITEKEDKLSGVEPKGDPEEFVLYECHCNLEIPGFEHKDADGNVKDFKIPYVVTLERDSGKILSIRRNYAENDPKCRKKQYFVHYKFLPGLGFYGFGLVHLLGNVARASTSALRQLIDAGTLSNLPGGFKTKGLRVANSQAPIQPGEWRDVDAPDGDVAKCLLPLPYKEPSTTLFNLLNFMIGAAEKFIGTTDLGLGDSNQEMPVGSVIALLERGSRIISSVHKRMHYAQKRELKLLCDVIAEALPDEYPYEVTGQQRNVKKSDFDARIDVIPVSDPNIFSMTQRIALAQEQMKLAMSAPQLHNMYEAHRRMYVALGVPDIDQILIKPPEPKPETPMTEHAKVLAITGTSPLKAFKEQDHLTHLQSHVEFYKTPLIQTVPPATVALMQHILEHITFLAKEKVQQTIAMTAQQGDQNALMMQRMLQQDPDMQNPGFQKLIAQAEAAFMTQYLSQLAPPQQPDPLVMLKAKELDIKQNDSQIKAAQGAQKLMLERESLDQQREIADERVASAERIADQRAEVALETARKRASSAGGSD